MNRESQIEHNLAAIVKNLHIINQNLQRLVREQRRTNIMFAKVYHLSWETVKDEDEDTRADWT